MPESSARPKLVVYGCGGHGKVVADLALALDSWDVLGFLDDAPPPPGPVLGLRILGGAAWLATHARDVSVALGIGDNRARRRIFSRVLETGARCPVLVHPTAAVAASARLSDGSVVLANAVINADAALGEGAIVNSGAIVEHDCRVGAFSHLSPNAALGGGARLGVASHLGLNGSVLPGVRVGDRCVVGAGAVVIRDLPDGVVAAGVPARVLRALESDA